MIPANAALPQDPVSPRTVRIEVPADHELRIDLLVSRDPPVPNADGKFEYPVEPEGALYTDTLRSGNQILINCSVQTMNREARKSMRSVILQMPTLRYSDPIDLGRSPFNETSRMHDCRLSARGGRFDGKALGRAACET
jgi:hypothetical protein